MEFNLIAIVFSVLSLIFFITTIYAFLQYKSKKKDSISLEGKLKQLKQDIETSEKQLLEITSQYEDKQKDLQHLIDLEKQENDLRKRVEGYQNSISELTNDIDQKTAQRDELSSEIANIKNDISIFSPTLDLINIGFFEEPDYLFETSDRFKEEIKTVREKQKEIIKNKKAIYIPEEVAVTSNSTYAKKILQGQVNLMLKAFNIECDKLLGSLKPSNFANTLERIDKVATDIEKTSLSLKCGFSQKYVKLKFEECELYYQFILKQQREREEQQRIKEQIREEQKAVREFERALAKAQKEEQMYQDALEEAQKQLEIAGDKDKEKLEDKIRLLQKQLEEAMEKEERAKSMAEQTRRGHVYIISNIGSFGEDVYKIGLTRRLEPLDRVKELGDASVPFSFDIHAMIYTEEAPNLESQLHKEFTYNRVNDINFRKEFFNISLEDIKDKVESITGNGADFKMT
ncbi:MAG: DUF4041 domain-containing protein, partial [Nitrospirota bacterium]